MTLRLPRLPENWPDQPVLVRRYFDEAMNQIEKLLNEITSIPEIQDALADLDTAVADASTAAANADAAASTANAAADDAAAAANASKTENSIVNSFPTLFTAPLISAASTGVLTIANHSRQYGDPTLNPTVSVTGGTLTTGATSTQNVRVYYDDTARAGGAVTYHFTVDPADPPIQGGSRHVVGAVTIPASGSTDGKSVRPPGFVDLN